MKFTLKVLGVLLGLVVLGPLLMGLIMKGLAADVPPPGKLVDVGGHRLHIYCLGSQRGSPPVLIEAGLGVSSSYYHWIQTNLARSTKVCTYDRAGLGWSDASTRPRELGDVVEQLHTLLDKSGFERPFVLAGHSIGAIVMREYVSRYPSEVAGLAFLDGSHPDQTRTLGLENLDLKAQAEQGISIYRLLVRSGLSRLYDPALTPLKAAFPKHIFAELQYTTDRSYFDTVLAEYDGLAPHTDRPRPNDNFGDRPTVVVQAGETWDPAALPESVDAAKVAAGWSKLQQDTASLSTKGRYVVVKSANHMSLIHDRTYANEAADLIREVLKAASAGAS
jgi:pimeloyl-ACP methyl ester carboxylesterase